MKLLNGIIWLVALNLVARAVETTLTIEFPGYFYIALGIIAGEMGVTQAAIWQHLRTRRR